MSQLTPKDIAAWHRSEAKRFEQSAKLHIDAAENVEREYQLRPDSAPRRLERIAIPAIPPGNAVITAAELESEVRKKKGRINGLAMRLGTNVDSIKSLLYPNSKVQVAARGWLEVRE